VHQKPSSQTTLLQPHIRAGILDDILGPFHFQFAPGSWTTRTAARISKHCADAREEYALATEFRHKSIFSENPRAATLAMGRERGLVNVVVEEPNTSATSIPAVWGVTHPALAFIRLHGRNHETW